MLQSRELETFPSWMLSQTLTLLRALSATTPMTSMTPLTPVLLTLTTTLMLALILPTALSPQRQRPTQMRPSMRRSKSSMSARMLSQSHREGCRWL
jgi:hypothetical protein